MNRDALRYGFPRIGLLACCALAWPATVPAADKQIDLTVFSQGSDFKMQFLNSECQDRPQENGCIEAEHGSSPVLQWELDPASEQYWLLTRLQFSADGVHWGDSAHPLADCTMQAFELEERDRYSGDASSAMVTGNGRKLQIRDRNEEVCQTHYRIHAMPRVGGAEIDSDPLIDNRGGANP
jgi:hypothetical protein